MYELLSTNTLEFASFFSILLFCLKKKIETELELIAINVETN